MCFSFSIVYSPLFHSLTHSSRGPILPLSRSSQQIRRVDNPPREDEALAEGGLRGSFIPCYTNCYSILKMNQLRLFNTSTLYNMPLPPTQIIYADNNKQLFSLTCQVVNKTTENLGFTDSIFG